MWYILCTRAHRAAPPKAARGHATSYSARIDGIVLSVTKNNVEIACTVRLRTFDGTYSWARKMSATSLGTRTMKGLVPRLECYRCWYRNAIQAISSPSTSSPGSSPTSVAGPDSEKVSPDASQTFAALDNSTTARHLLLHKLEGGNDSIERSSR